MIYQVLRGSDIYFETENKDEALALFDDLLMWGFRDREVPKSAQLRRESYRGPAIGVCEVRSKMIVRACGEPRRVSIAPSALREIDTDLELLVRQINE